MAAVLMTERRLALISNSCRPGNSKRYSSGSKCSLEQQQRDSHVGSFSQALGLLRLQLVQVSTAGAATVGWRPRHLLQPVQHGVWGRERASTRSSRGSPQVFLGTLGPGHLQDICHL